MPDPPGHVRRRHRDARPIAGLALLALAVAAAGAQAPGPRPPVTQAIPLDAPGVRELVPAGDAVARLLDRMASGDAGLTRDDGGSYLRSVLRVLDVPIDSQLLVFSKTSVQAAHISPARPRAIYFSDDVMVAHVPGTPGVEVAAVDAARGPVFYALDERAGRPVFTPSTSCLRCHHGPNTAGVPGVYVGSVIPGPSGAPLRGHSAIVTGSSTPFWERWGGWYVTAARGEPKSRANAAATSSEAPDRLVRRVPPNVHTLEALFDPGAYLAPTSDLVALLVFEHQTLVTNLLTRVAWQARLAAGSRPGPPAGSTLADDVRALVDALLFAGEAPLPARVQGVSSFAATFAARGPRDRAGRSLRDFDLETRIFRYPLSFLVYGAQFQALPPPVRAAVLAEVKRRLDASAPGPRFPHLTAPVRAAIRDIVRATVSGLPAGW